MTETIPFIRGSRLADALGVDKKTVHARAMRESWPMQKDGNRFEYQPPSEVAALCGSRGATSPTDEEAPRVKFTDLPPDSNGRKTALRRQESVQLVESIMQLGRETARRQTVAMMVTKYTDFNISTRSLLRWEKDFAKWGIDGLVEQKLGKSGRKGIQVPDSFANLGKAMVIEHGSIARAARELMSHPELPAAMRERLHEGHASKSYVTPSIRAAIRPAPLTAALAQGPRHARLSDRFTPGDYSNVKAGDVFVSDDMTSNVYCWTEWPNAQGWIIGRPQVLPVMDVGALRWLNARVVMREGGQYSADDIWGLFGDVFDLYGLPRQGFLLEGGHWQSKSVVGQEDPHIGHRTGVHDDDRIGGLSSLGLKVFRSYDPRSKGMLEGAFNQFQYLADAFPGYAGRDQRRDMPEAFKKQLALLQAKHPVHHPREFLPHISQLSDHIADCFAKLNLERNDGHILRGACPLDKWTDEAANLVKLPDSAKWLYRSAMSVVEVTKNGARVTLGSGKKMMVYYYDNPALLTPLKGQKVVVYWNHYNPDADAVIMVKRDGQRRFLCTAKRVQPLERFSATDEELAAEAQRKNQAMKYSRTELRAIQPDMVRKTSLVPVDSNAVNIGAEIRNAAERAEVIEAEKTDLKRIEQKFKRRALESADEPETISRAAQAPTVGISESELNEL